jgi:hypothetical protein
MNSSITSEKARVKSKNFLSDSLILTFVLIGHNHLVREFHQTNKRYDAYSKKSKRRQIPFSLFFTPLGY